MLILFSLFFRIFGYRLRHFTATAPVNGRKAAIIARCKLICFSDRAPTTCFPPLVKQHQALHLTAHDAEHREVVTLRGIAHMLPNAL